MNGALFRPALCVAHDPTKAGLCAEPPVIDGNVRCATCGAGTGLLEGIILYLDIEMSEMGGSPTVSALGKGLGVKRAPLEKWLVELMERGIIAPIPPSVPLEGDQSGLNLRVPMLRRAPVLLTDEGRAVARRLRDQQRAEIDAAMDAAMARDATNEELDARGDLAADAARERRMFGPSCRFRG